jgi:hypothetical protein
MDGGMREERALGRIAALLVTLSLVAERAAGRSWPVRFLLLLVLRRAEAVATAFVVREAEAVGAGDDDFPWLDEEADSGSSPLHAAWFALRFRALAEVLDLCCAAGRSGDDTGDTAGNWANNRADNPTRLPATAFPILLLFIPARRGLLVHDTS